MNKVVKWFKCRIPCANAPKDREMVNLSQFSPRVTRASAKKQQKIESEYQQKKTEDEPQKKSRNVVGRPRGKRKTKSSEVNSVRASRGSVGTISLLRTPTHQEALQGGSPRRPGCPSPARGLHPPNSPLLLKSPPIGTLSADTPERSAHFHRQIENVSESRLRILGKGSFGTIIQATYKGELVAAKVVPPQKAASLKNELNNFLLSHPNIVRTLRIISNEDNHSCGLVIMEMCSSFTLEHLFNEESFVLDERAVVSFMTDVGRALDYCHSQKVLHLDVKPPNILVNVTTNVCKLCDFGSSCLIMGEEAYTVNCDSKTLQSTVVYTSPELLTGDTPTDKSDVYSFGITLWQLIHREKPYVVDNKIDLQSTIYKIVKQKKRPHKRPKKDGALDKLYTICWHHEPARRPTMKEVINRLEVIHASQTPATL